MRDAPGWAESPGATNPPDEAPVFADVTRKRDGVRSPLRAAPRLYVVLAAGRRLRRRLCRSAALLRCCRVDLVDIDHHQLHAAW